ncbi:MAG: hypothetical protein JWR59_2458 [Brevundimonas sp.]|nr:hypothetical protein [Brevundimonas sp.]
MKNKLNTLTLPESQLTSAQVQDGPSNLTSLHPWFDSTAQTNYESIENKDKKNSGKLGQSSPQEPEDKKKNKKRGLSSATALEDSQLKSPIYPNSPVKVYDNAAESQKDIARDFKRKCVIYM